MDKIIRQYLFKIVVALVFTLLLASCTLPENASIDGTQSIQLVQPQDGAQFNVGEEVSVISTFSDPGGAQGVILEVNGVGTRDDKLYAPMFQGNMDQPWRPIQNGPATLCVYLSTSDGKFIRSNCVTVTIGAVKRPTSTAWVTITPQMELTTTPTLTFTPGAPTATANQDANCRLGPSVDYGVKGNLLTNQSAPITGRNVDSSWWVIQIPGSGDCWIWDGTVTIAGDISQVAVITPPPAPIAITPLTAPSQISPSGTLNCADASGGVTLKWSAVSHPNGIDHYEWVLEGPISDSGSTGSTQASTLTLSCAGANYQWRARAVDGKGNIGPWSSFMQFNVP
ncbi:MAG: hypothetical protein HQ525_06595 [Anaerolineae bacterium]|nr:hypothetical protein [Anaerolineae bacterium]